MAEFTVIGVTNTFHYATKVRTFKNIDKALEFADNYNSNPSRRTYYRVIKSEDFDKFFFRYSDWENKIIREK